MMCKKLTETDKAYIAGIIDGEGCIQAHLYLKNNKHKTVYFITAVSITTTNVVLVKYFKDKFNTRQLSIINYGKTKCWKGRFSIRINKHYSQGFLQAILPYLVIKKRQAQIYLSLDMKNLSCETSKIDKKGIWNQRTKVVAELKILNRKGR